VRRLAVAVALAAAVPVVSLAQGAEPAAPQGAPPAAPAQPAPGQYAPPPQGYAPPPQGYAPPPGQYPPGYAPQYAPPPAYAPPPQYPPAAYPPAPAPARRYQRDSWYIGFGLGGGDGEIQTADNTYSFKRYIGKSPSTVSLGFKVGATLSPRLLAGFDLSGIGSSAKEGDTTVSVTIVNYDVMATFFPMERGLFLRGGLGLSRFTLDLKNIPTPGGGTTHETGTRSGTNVALGVGYAFWLGQHFNLTANLDFSNQWWRGRDEGGAPTRSDFWALGLGFDWY
jgi:hypothetical protein